MIEVTGGAMREALAAVGLAAGDAVMVYTNLARIGKVGGARGKQEALQAYLDALLDTVGRDRGTIIVPTFTYAYGRNGTPFIYEDTPSDLCMFSEFVRRQPGSLRALHPHFSCTALGSEGEKFCGGVSRSAFGYDSVFDRLHRFGAKILFIGTTITEGLTFHLYIEHMVGVSHCYHKAYFHPVFKDGREIKGPFFTYVRHLVPGLESDLTQFEAHLQEANLVREARLASGKVQLVTAREVFLAGYRKLQENPCYFYRQPYFVTA